MSQPPQTTPPEEAASVASSQRSASLLERIQAQRQREQEQHLLQSTTPQQINVPVYRPDMESSDPMTMSSVGGGGSNNNIFSQAWRSVAGEQQESLLSSDSLQPLTMNDNNTEENYSMTNYFVTFVTDVYSVWQRLPVPIRWIVFLALLYVAIRLL